MDIDDIKIQVLESSEIGIAFGAIIEDSEDYYMVFDNDEKKKIWLGYIFYSKRCDYMSIVSDVAEVWKTDNFRNNFITFLRRTTNKETLLNGLKLLAMTTIYKKDLTKVNYDCINRKSSDFRYEDSKANIILGLCDNTQSDIKDVIQELDVKCQTIVLF